VRKERIETKRGNEGGKWKEVKLKFLKSFLSRLVFAIATFPYMSIHSIVAFFCIHSRGNSASCNVWVRLASWLVVAVGLTNNASGNNQSCCC